MAFDLEYILTECTHRIHDEILYEATLNNELLASDSSYFGSSYFGRSRFGRSVFYINNKYGNPDGVYFNNSDGTVTAIFNINNTIAGSPELFYQSPKEYLRHPLPRYSDKDFDYIYYGTEVFYGEDQNLVGDKTNIPSESTQELWFVTYEPTVYNGYYVPANSIVIKKFDNNYNWILDYNTVQNECPYCEGSGACNDLNLDPIGRLKVVTGMDKLIQQVIKAIITPQGKNIFFPEYGTIIPNAIGSRGLNGFILRNEIISQLKNIMENQRYILENNPSFFTADEVLHDLIGVVVQPSEDPRRIDLTVTIQNKALEERTSKSFKIK
mgnify:CR=1 FL=1